MYCLKCGENSIEKHGTCESCGAPMDADYDQYFKAGLQAMAIGDLERAIAYLSNCIELNPNHVSGRFNLGMALSLANRCDEALQHYVLVLDMDPDYPGIFTALGQSAFGNYLLHKEEAEIHGNAMMTYLITALEQDPNDVDACFSLAHAYLALGNAEKAVPLLENAMDLHSDSPAIHYTLAKALKLLGKEERAIDIAKRSMELAESSDDPFIDEMQELYEELQEKCVHT